MNYKTPEIILWGGVTAEYGFATSLSSQNDQIYFSIGDSDNEFTKVESSN